MVSPPENPAQPAPAFQCVCLFFIPSLPQSSLSLEPFKYAAHLSIYHPPVCAPYPSTYPPIHLFLYPSIFHLSIFIYVLTCPSTTLSFIHLPIYLPIHTPIFPQPFRQHFMLPEHWLSIWHWSSQRPSLGKSTLGQVPCFSR